MDRRGGTEARRAGEAGGERTRRRGEDRVLDAEVAVLALLLFIKAGEGTTRKRLARELDAFRQLPGAGGQVRVQETERRGRGGRAADGRAEDSDRQGERRRLPAHVVPLASSHPAPTASGVNSCFSGYIDYPGR
jgi:hypothetical protein